MDQTWIIIGGIVIAGLNAYTAWMTNETRNLARKTEVNTNSMREQLVAATKIASHAEGVEAGRAEGVTERAVLTEKLDQANK